MEMTLGIIEDSLTTKDDIEELRQALEDAGYTFYFSESAGTIEITKLDHN